MAKQNWTQEILKRLPATVAQLHKDPVIRQMRDKHLQQRKARGAFIVQPCNSMTYDTLYRLRRRGVVSYDSKTRVYTLVK
jgi:hypothetical protein